MTLSTETQQISGSRIPADKLEGFLRSLADPSAVIGNYRQLTAHFAYFLSEILGEREVTIDMIKECYATAAVHLPLNMADVIRKSKVFVKTARGYQLHRSERDRIHSNLNTAAEPVKPPVRQEVSSDPDQKGRNVVVVHGRDRKLRGAMFQFLTALRLNPIDWNEAVRRTGQGSPYTGHAVDALFQDRQVIVVLLTPDERVELREDLRDGDSQNVEWQPRPNVFIEAGMALARDEAHTILVQIGRVREASDFGGRNLIRLDNSAEQRNSLIQRLQTAGCATNTIGNDWLSAGDFAMPTRLFDSRRRPVNEPQRTQKKVHRRR